MSEKNGTLIPSKPPPGTKALLSGVILKLNRDTLGISARFKARFIARDNFQFGVVDYTGLYAPVAYIELVRLVQSVATSKGSHIDQLDGKGAFLHANLPDSDRT